MYAYIEIIVGMDAGKCIWNMGTSDLTTFRFLKISKFYISICLNYGVKSIKRYIEKEHTQKSPVKKYFIF
jgi:hypothetical protein